MNFYKRQSRTPTVILVSLIDIFAILLIFVIVTTTFKTVQPEVVIRLPESTTAEPSDELSGEPFLIHISSEGDVHLDDKVLAMADLKTAVMALASGAPQRRFALRADTKAPFGTIIGVLDVLKEAGLSSRVSAFTEKRDDS